MFEGATGLQDYGHDIPHRKKCMAFELLLHVQGVFYPKTPQNRLKTPIFRLKSGTTVAPREIKGSLFTFFTTILKNALVVGWTLGLFQIVCQ